MPLTKSDQQLLALLRENARTSTAQLARRMGVSRTTVQSRLERLERDGVISGYTVRVHDAHEQGQIRAVIGIAVHPKQMSGVVTALKAMPELRSLHSVSGAWDLIAVAVVPAIAEMDELTDRIGAVEGVDRTTTSIILSTKFER